MGVSPQRIGSAGRWRVGGLLAAGLISFCCARPVVLAGSSAGANREDAESCFRKGISAYQKARYGEAIRALEKSLQVDTGWQEYPYYYLLLSHWKLDHVEQTLGLCKQFQSRFPQSPLSHRVARLEADGFVRSREPRLAAQAYEKLMRTRDSGDLRLAYGEVLVSINRPSDAHRNYQAVRRKWPRSASAREAGRRAEKIEEAVPVLRNRLKTEQGLLDEAELCLREGNGADAASLFGRLLQMPLSPSMLRRVLSGRIDALANSGRLDDARIAVFEMLELYPKSPQSVRSLYAVARGYWVKDRNPDAVLLLERLLRQYGNSPEAGRAAFVLGRICVEDGDLEGAIRRFRKLRFLFPGTELEREAAWWEVWCQYRRGDYAASAALLEEFDSGGVWIPVLVPRARYWHARSLERTGDRARSRAIYRNLVQDRPDDYYGILARNRLRGEYLPTRLSTVVRSPPARQPQAQMVVLSQRLQDPALPVLLEAGLHGDLAERLKWLQRTGRGRTTLDAQDWFMAYSMAGDLPAAMGAAQSGGILDRILREGLSARDAQRLEMLRLLYPLPYWDLIRTQAELHGLDPFLVAGLIRQESQFRPDVVSSAGAVGLMQIMPATGRQMAEKLGMTGFNPSRLSDPETNIRIGTSYLAGLRGRYGSDWNRILANYNAGPRAVGKWTASMPDAAFDEFVENILYLETRLYVKKVLFNWDVYRHAYGSGRK